MFHLSWLDHIRCLLQIIYRTWSTCMTLQPMHFKAMKRATLRFANTKPIRINPLYACPYTHENHPSLHECLRKLQIKTKLPVISLWQPAPNKQTCHQRSLIQPWISWINLITWEMLSCETSLEPFIAQDCSAKERGSDKSKARPGSLKENNTYNSDGLQPNSYGTNLKFRTAARACSSLPLHAESCCELLQRRKNGSWLDLTERTWVVSGNK